MVRIAQVFLFLVAAALLAGCNGPAPTHDLVYQGEKQYKKEWRQRNHDTRELREGWCEWEATYGTTYDNNRLNPRPYKD